MQAVAPMPTLDHLPRHEPPVLRTEKLAKIYGGRRVIFMNPEQQAFWRQGDSDMYAYAPLCDTVLQVATLQQLEEAIDKLFEG